jgi:transcriptional regulator with XRE-family HTH domain
MKDRIQKILQDYSISSTKLADKLNVQRSSISHILSGRNKPGYEFIQKLLKNYPEINARWLILGKGSMYVNDNQPTLPFSESTGSTTPREKDIRSEPHTEYQIRNSQEGKLSKQKKIKKIVMFFDDHSFEEYYPNEE